MLFHTEVELLGDGGLQLVELNPPDPWLADPRERLVLKEGEVKVCAFCCSHNIILYNITLTRKYHYPRIYRNI